MIPLFMTNTDYAIVGFLHHGNFSGYDIKKLMDESIPHFWEESYTKIYQSLKRLEENAWVYSISVDQSGKPDKKIYQITEEGRKMFAKWIAEEVEPTEDINIILLKVFFGAEGDKSKTKKNLEIFLEESEIQQKIYKKYKEFVKGQKSTDKTKYWLMTIDYVLNKIDFEIKWAKNSIKEIS